MDPGEEDVDGERGVGGVLMGTRVSLAIPDSTSIILWATDACNTDSRACLLNGSTCTLCGDGRSVA